MSAVAASAPHRAVIEHMVRQAVYAKLGKPLPRTASGQSPLVVNVSARHCHLTPEAVEILFGKGAKYGDSSPTAQNDNFKTKVQIRRFWLRQNDEQRQRNDEQRQRNDRLENSLNQREATVEQRSNAKWRLKRQHLELDVFGA